MSFATLMVGERECAHCGRDLGGRHPLTAYCQQHGTPALRGERVPQPRLAVRAPRQLPDRRFWRERAKRAVAAAVEAGVLPRLADVPIACTDCPKRAREYDHRDYAKWLIVDPVCSRCNKRRGPGVIPAPEAFRFQPFVSVKA